MLDMKQFYLIAGVLMLISFGGQIWNLAIIWNLATIGAKISTLAGGVLFNLLLSALFLGLWYKMPKTPDMVVDNNELDKLMEELTNQNVEDIKNEDSI